MNQHKMRFIIHGNIISNSLIINKKDCIDGFIILHLFTIKNKIFNEFFRQIFFN